MVVHDELRLQQWSQAREEKQNKEKQRLKWRPSVFAVQSVACCVMLLI